MHNDSIGKKLLYGLCGLIPDELFLKLKFRKNFGRWPDFRNPKTFNEKLNWLKLYDRRPEYTRMVDKAEAKRYVAERIGEEYVIPTYGVWDRAEDIDFDALPDKFVMKATHDSGRVIICRDKSKLDIDDARRAMHESLRRNFYAVTREWPYKNVKPRIIAEQLLESDGDPADFKVHCFNGVPKAVLVCRDRFREAGLTEDFFDPEWHHLDISRPGHANAAVMEKAPSTLSRMLELSRVLSDKYPFIRVDFYEVGGRLYFGELTFYPASGMVPFIPEEIDSIWGEALSLKEFGGGGKLLIYKDIALYVGGEGLSENQINDYKFFCFNGKVRYMKIDFDRSTNHKANYFDADGRIVEWGEAVCPPDLNRNKIVPETFGRMKQLAEKLSAGFPFLRVDFYSVNGSVYFGELTFFPNSGMGEFTGSEVDLDLGNLIDLRTIVDCQMN